MVIVRIRRGDGSKERLSFDKAEVSLGRDASLNDIVILEPSVSKNHAVIARTASAIVLRDLRSTNGTLVNGAPISGTMPLRPTDEIAIGSARIWIDPETMRTPLHTYETKLDPISPNDEPSRGTRVMTGLRDETGPTVVPVLPAHRGNALLQVNDRTDAPPMLPKTIPPPPPREIAPHAPLISMSEAIAPIVPDLTLSKPTKIERSVANSPVDGVPIPSSGSPDGANGFGLALAKLVERVAKATNVEPFTKATRPTSEAIKKLEEVVWAQVNTMNVTDDVASRLAAAVQSEFVDIGPLRAWLSDPEIKQIQCLRFDRIDLLRGGQTVPADRAFSSEAALHLALRRLAKASGKDLSDDERVVDRCIDGGARLVAVLPPISPTPGVTIRKPEPVLQTMDELVQRRVLSPEMAEFLERCMGVRSNVVVCGNVEQSVLDVVAALASQTANTSRIAVFHTGREILAEGRNTIPFGLPESVGEEESALRAALLLGFEHMMIVSPKATSCANAISAITAGATGVVVGIPARTLSRGLTLTAGELVLAKPGLSYEAASYLVCHAIEIAIEVHTADDGQAWVSRICEVDPGPPAQPFSLRDLFVYVPAEGTREATFRAAADPSRIDALG